MAEGHNNQLEIKFLLPDGSGLGPKAFLDATTVSRLKETVVSEWPSEKRNGPKTVKEVRLISAGKILENNKTVKDYRMPALENNKTVKNDRSPVSNVVTMHVIIQPSVTEKENKPKGDPKMNKCVCSVM